MRLEAQARAIMKKLKGWNAEDMRHDFRDHPEAHRHELTWLVRRLEKVRDEPAHVRRPSSRRRA